MEPNLTLMKKVNDAFSATRNVTHAVVITLLFALVTFAANTQAQNIVTTLGTVSTCPNQDILVPINVQNFSNVASASLQFTYDTTVMSPILQSGTLKYSNLNSNISGVFLANDDAGTVTIGFFVINGSITIGSGLLVNLCFHTHNHAGYTDLTWNPNPNLCNYSDPNFNILPSTFVNGNVHTSPSISVQPLPITLTPGGTGSISVTGVEAISYQWQVSTNSGTSYNNLSNDATYSNVTTNTLTISNAQLSMNNYKYRCVIGGNCTGLYNFTNSNAVNLTVSIPCPTAYQVSGGGTVCSSGPGAVISVANSELGVFYQLKNGLTLVGSPITGIGSAISFPAQTAPGTYTVTGTNDCGSTVMTGTATIVNVSPPTASISGTPQVCAGVTAQLNVNLTGSKPLTLIYTDGTNQFTINGITQNFYPLQVSPIVTTTYTLVSVNNVYCSGTVSGSGVVTVKPAPQITISNNGPLCPGATLNLTANGGISYQWAGPNSFFTTTQNPSITNVTTLNIGTYSVTVTGSNSCTGSGSTEVIVNPATPSAAGTITGPTTACQGTTGITFTVPPITGATTYIWTVPSGVTITSGSNTNSIVVSISGTATTGVVSVHGENICGIGATSNHGLTISSVPVASASAVNSPVCAGLTLNLQASGGSSYLWSGPNGFTSAIQNPSINNVTLAASGSYSVTVSNSGGCSAVATFDATVNPVPTASAGSNSPICAGQALNLTSGIASSYSWTGPNGFVSNVQNPSIPAAQISATGTYSLTITNSSNCQATTTISVTVKALPIAGASNTGPVCAGSPLTLHATGGSTYSWSGPIGFINGTQDPVIASAIVANSGIYTVTVTGSNGCSSTATTSATVNARPIANAGPDQNTTIGNAVTLSGSASGGSGVYSYSWSPAASLVNANIQNPTTIALTSTTTFSLVVTDLSSSCQSAAAQVVVNISSTPLTVGVSVLPSNIICQGSQIQLTANAQGGSGNYTYSWSSVPVGFTSSIFNPTATPNVTTVYTVTVSDGISNTTGNVEVTVNPLPTVYGVGGGGGYCEGTPGVNVTLSGSQVDYSYSLFLNGIYQSQVIGNGQPLSFGPITEPGTYTISALSPSGCPSLMTGETSVFVNPNPVVNAGNDQTINVGSTALLSGSVVGSGSFNYSWTPASLVAEPGSSTTATLPLTSTTTFTFHVTNSSTGCSGSGQVVINVNNVPLTVEATGNPLAICYGSTTTLSAVAAGGTGSYTYTWTAPDGFSAVGAVIDVNPTSSMTYTVEVSDGISIASTIVDITVNALPLVYNVLGGGNVCTGSGVDVSLEGSQSGVDYQLFLDGIPTATILSGNGSSLSFGSVTLPGTYTVVGTNTTTLCSSLMDFEAFVQVFNKPIANAGPDQNIQYNTSTTLSGLGTGKSGDSYTYQWEPADMLVNANLQHPTTLPLIAPTTFTLVVTNLTSGCASLPDTVFINVTSPYITVNASATPEVVCAGASVQLNATVSGGTGSYTYSWTSVPAGFTSSIINPTVNPTQSTSYTLEVSDGITSTSSSASVVVNQLPTAFTVSGGGNACSASAGLMVNLSGSEVGVQYSLYIDGALYGVIGTGTGSAVSYGPYSTSGTYTILGQSNGCENWMTGEAIINIITTPVIIANPSNININEGGSGSFQVISSTECTFQWQVSIDGGTSWTDVTNTGVYEGSTTSVLDIIGATLDMNGYLYHCILTNTGCSVTTTDALLHVSVVGQEIITSIGNLGFCPGQISVPINVQNLNNIASISLTLQYNSSVLQYTGFSNVNAGLNNQNLLSINATPSLIQISYYTLTPSNVGNGVLLDLNFNYLGGTSNLNWDLSVPEWCEYTDIDAITLPASFVSGSVYPNATTPVISSNPLNSSVMVGNPALFSIVASGATSYIWQISTDGTTWTDLVDGIDYNGVTTSTLNIPVTTLDMSGNKYRCVVSESVCGLTANSNLATLTVHGITNDIVTTIGSTQACAGNTVAIPFAGQNLENVAAISLTLLYDPAVLEYTGYQNLNPVFNPSDINIYSIPGNWRFSWFSLTPISLASGNFADITFNYMGGTSNLTWDVTTPGACEYNDFDGNPIQAVYSNGVITPSGAMPQITSQPASIVVEDGSNGMFSVSATNADSYQWQVSSDGGIWTNLTDGGVYSGVTTSVLTLTGVTYSMNGSYYRCVVTSGVCTASSDVAMLTVTPFVTDIITTIGNATACPGNQIIIPVNGQFLYNVAAISLTLNYNPAVISYEGTQNLNSAFNPSEININAIPGQWFFSWFSLTPVSLASADLIDLVFTYNGGTTNLTWDVATPGFCEYNDYDGNSLAAVFNNGVVTSAGVPAEIVGQPLDQTVNEGDNANFSIVANNATAYQWQISTNGGGSWSNITDGGMYSGSTTSNLMLTAVNYTLNANQYRCIVTGEICVVTSTAATLSVYATGSVIITTASDVTACAGNNVIVPVNGKYLYNVAAISLTMLYDPAVLTYNNIVNLNSAFNMADVNIFSVPGDLRFSWFSLTPINLYNENLFDIDFNFNGGYTDLTWDVVNAGNCEYNDFNGNTLLATFNNGSVSSAGIAPTFTLQPSGVTINHHDNATFSVVVTGAVSYQWQVSMNGGVNWSDLSESVPYSGVTTPDLLITNAIYLYNGYQYRCVVTGAVCTVTSAAAILTVIPPEQFTIVTTAGSENACPGSDILIPITVTDLYNVASISLDLDYDASVLEYQGFTNLYPGLTGGLVSPTPGEFVFSWYSLTPISLGDDKIVDLMFHYNGGSSNLTWDFSSPGLCEYTDFDANTLAASFVNGTVNSSAVQPVINVNPVDFTAYASQSATFTVDATNAVSYQWQVSADGGNTWADVIDGATYTGATTSTLVIPNLVYDLNNNLYQVVITGTCGLSATSTSALLTVIIQPTIVITAGSGAFCGNNIVIPITAENFNNVAAMSLTLNYDNTVLTYTGYQNVNPILSTGVIVISELSGQVKAGLFSVAPLNIGNGLLFEYLFTSTGGNSALTWDLTTPGNCEIANIDEFLLTANYVDGNVVIYPLPTVSLDPSISVCINAEPVVLNGLPEGGTYSGTGLVGNVFYPAVAGAGVHTISYTITGDNNCVNTATQQITVNALPEIIFNALAPICLNADPIVLNALPEGGVYSGIGINGNMFNPTIAGVGTSTITYTYTDVNGCVNSASQEITVNNLPVVSLDELAAVCIDVPSVTLNGLPEGGTYSGIGVEGNMFYPATAGTGTFTITYTYTGTNGCTVSTSQTITVNALPEVSFEPLSNICINAAPVILNGIPAGGIFTGTGVDGNMFNPAVAGAGTFTITYTYTDGNGCTNSASQEITVLELTEITFNALPNICLNADPIALNALPEGGVFTGVGVDQNMFYPSISGAGTFAITYTYTGENGCANSVIQNITVNELPQLVAVGTTGICPGESTDITVEFIGGVAPWTFVLNGTSVTTSDNPYIFTVTPSMSTTYNFTSVSDGNMCTNMIQTSVNIAIYPITSILTSPVSVTLDETGNTSFSVTAENATGYQWQVSTNGGVNWIDLTDGGVYSGANTNTLMLTGVTLVMNGYQYQCNVIGNCPVSSISGAATLNLTPIIKTIAGSAVSCAGNIVIPITVEHLYGVASMSLSLNYDNSVLNYVGYQNVNPELSTNGFYQIDAYNSQIKAGYFSVVPANIGNGLLFDVIFSSTGGFSDLTWDVVTVGNCEYQNLAGNNITSVYINGNVLVHPTPIVTLAPVSPICQNGGIVTLNGMPAGGIYSGSGVTGNHFNPEVAGVGTHAITYTYTDEFGCTNFATQDITVLEATFVTISNLAPVCQNIATFALIEGQPAGGTYSGVGVVSNTFNPALAGVGTHTITYTLTNNNGCTTSASTTIVVNPVSNPIILPVAPLCYNAAAVSLVGVPTGGVFSGAGVVGNTFDPTTVATGIHTVTYTFTNSFGCNGSATINIEVYHPLQFTVFGGGAYCTGGNGLVVALGGSEVGIQYHLYLNGISTGVVVTGTGSVLSFGPQTIAGTYTVVAENSGTACSVPMLGSAEISINPAPNVYTGGYSVICQGTSTTLNANVVGGTGPYNYQWIPATGLSNPTIANPVANPTATAFYTVIVTDANGCTDSDNALVVVNQAPNVNAGPDKTITIGLSTTLSSFVSGGHGPYTYSWTPATGLNNANILSPVASPLVTTVYTLVATDSYGCVGTDQVTVNVTNTVFGYDIFGQVTYDNTLSSPMSNTTVLLKNVANTTIATGLTDMNGNYTLPQIPNGNYTTDGTCTKAWGGVNSLDALKIARHFQNLEVLSGLRLQVGDVDGNGVVNANDALLVMQRSVHMISNFPINADWAFEIKNIYINNAAVPNSFKSLCYGDVNGSYIPPVKAAPSVALDNSGTQYINSFSEFSLPIKAGKTMQLGAASLAINFPANSIEIVDVVANSQSKGNLVYNITDGVLYIEWYSLSTVTLDANDDLFTLKVRSSSLSTVENLRFEITGGSELGNEDAAVIENAVLTMPKVKVATAEFNLSNNYPNPFNASTTISYTLPENGKVSLKLYNHIGEEVSELTNAQQTAGRYEVVVDGSKLPQGVYIYKIDVQGETKTFVQSKRMVVTR